MQAAEEDITAAECLHGGLGPYAAQSDQLRVLMAQRLASDRKQDRRLCMKMLTPRA